MGGEIKGEGDNMDNEPHVCRNVAQDVVQCDLVVYHLVSRLLIAHLGEVLVCGLRISNYVFDFLIPVGCLRDQVWLAIWWPSAAMR